MAGRFAYVMVAGAALVGGMYFQGDLNFGDDGVRDVARSEQRDARIDRRTDRIDRIDRIVDRETDKIERRGNDVDPATRRALAEAVAELVRAEGSLVAIKLDDQIPAAVIKQAEHRRDLARQAVDRLADDVQIQSRSERDDLRETIRDEIRDAVRG